MCCSGQDWQPECLPPEYDEVLLCTSACDSLNSGELDAVFLYIFGPLSLIPYPEITFSDPVELQNLSGRVYARVDKGRSRMQSYYRMDIGGHILVSIADKGPLLGSFVPFLPL